MARRPSTPYRAPPKTAGEQKAGLARLREALSHLAEFDIPGAHPDDPSALDQLTAEIATAVDRAFSEGSPDHDRFSSASSIHGFHRIQMGAPFGRGQTGPNLNEYREGLAKDMGRSKGLLQAAIAGLERDLQDAEVSQQLPAAERQKNNKVFIVHGRADGPKNAVARFLGDLGVEPIVLHEQPNQGRSTIEKIEAFGDVDFAVVLFTPDDLGGLAGESAQPRARQNVIFELGYFIAKLQRANVCVLMVDQVEVLTDYIGPIWVAFDSAGAWKTELARELRASGVKLNYEAVLRALGL